MTKLLPPASCETMTELGTQIDAIDAKLVHLLSDLSGYIDRAIDLKQIEGLPARIVDRVDEVLDNVHKNVTKHRLDPELTQTLWRELIECSFQGEAKQLDV